ncbi:DUF1203 domain-containing protein [Saccharopolyspora dendranthemae]|uniref:Uncharacterized protein DUF1203 n=1 Tax=Saccharopolyspora dendranthemae TaxID=1181886 RepID=A0A561U4P6_9PSEU|nr:DUF1203 domain-containing protein [Saccharopolyspora dendranthemae]TWF94330.1 uncharacterized protein DUF1203 [Saccharopolyspora dendranthemae]
MDFHVLPIAPDVLDALRDVDDAGHRSESYVDEVGDAPLRCCLRRSRPGERIALVSYAPLRRWAAKPGAYDEVGPVFIHARTCPGPDDPGWPEPLRGTRRVLRSYSADGRILGGSLLDGNTGLAERTASDLLLDPAVEVVHVRAVEFGCFLFEVRRR